MKQVPIPLLPNILTLILLPLHIFSATTEFIVTVGDKTGGGLAYRLNSIEAPSLTFALGETYRFKLDGITTADHPFFFSTDDGGGASTEGEYTTGVINSQSSSGFVEITIKVSIFSVFPFNVRNFFLQLACKILNSFRSKLLH